MNTLKTFLISLFLLVIYTVSAQTSEQIPQLSMVEDALNWTLVNRTVSRLEHVSLDAKPGDGLLYLNDFEFENGTIELDIKGKNDPGRSFVGLAFHILNDSTFDAIYFRPFNFENPERNAHSVQYISMPEYDWSRLRTNFPGKYENSIMPVPHPDEWFHAKIDINYPEVRVYVNNSHEASLVVDQISDQRRGFVGFWVGNASEGNFKNLKIIMTP